ncbi:IS3 family transposase, partial [Clostridium estertheticum]|nr:IS3 family transposase [Clostridium estertheticum]MPQ63888.1 IS3 family transposase [Clostridium estertheticum]
YYLHKFEDYESLKKATENYIDYYNNRRYQKRLKCMTPIEYHRYLLGNAA